MQIENPCHIYKNLQFTNQANEVFNKIWFIFPSGQTYLQNSLGTNEHQNEIPLHNPLVQLSLKKEKEQILVKTWRNWNP